MSKKFRYFSLLMMVLVLFSITAVSAMDINDTGTSYAISDSSVQDINENVTDNKVSDSINSTYNSLSCEIQDSNAGNHNLKVSAGDSDNNSEYVNKAFTDSNASSDNNLPEDNAVNILGANNSKKTVISGDNLTMYYRDGSRFNFYLKDSDANPLANQTVHFKVGNVVYDLLTDNNGMASINIGLNPTDILVSYYYLGNNNYLPSNGSARIIVNKKSYVVETNDFTEAKGEGKYFTAVVRDNLGNVLANQNLSFEIVGKTYKVVTDASGVAKLRINLWPGNYSIKTSVDGNRWYNSFSTNNTVKVVKNSTATTITGKNLNMYYRDGSRFNFYLKDSDGNPLANQTVHFRVWNGVYDLLTDDNGMASMNIGLNPGNITVYYYFSGNSQYDASNGKANIIVNKKSYSVATTDFNENWGDGKYFTALVRDNLGNVLANQNLSFEIVGKTYKVVTDASGVAKLRINLGPGNYSIKTSVDGNRWYNSFSTSNTVKVVKNSTVIGLISGNNYISGETLKIQLKDIFGMAISDAVINVNINGVNYNVTTDDNGIGSFIVPDINKDSYNLTYKYISSNSKLSSSGLNQINVYKNQTSIAGDDFTTTNKSGDEFTVKLLDQYGNPLANQTVHLKLNGTNVIYNRITDEKGIAKLSINLLAGNYVIIYYYDGNDKYPSSNGSAKLTVLNYSAVNTNITSNTFGVFVLGSDMYNINLETYAKNHIGNIFLNYYAIEKWGTSAVQSFITKAKTYNINVYIWMQTFYNGSWVNPATVGYTYWNNKINEALSYVKFNGIAGIALDYLRYPGTAYKYSNGTSSITKFTKQLTESVKKVNANIKVAVVIMPETQNVYYYGQDSDELGQYADILLPMIYKGNYGANSSWIKTTSEYFKNHRGNAQVWTVIQAYGSDTNTTKLSVSQLKTDAQNALNGGASGVVLFRYGLTNVFDVATLNDGNSNMNNSTGTISTNTTNSTVKSVSLSQILAASKVVKEYYNKNRKLPSTVTVGSIKVSLAQFLYYESKAIDQINSGNKSNISIVGSLDEPSSPNLGDNINGNLLKSAYADSAKRTWTFILNYDQGPNYSTTTLGRVSYNNLILTFAIVLDYYNTNKTLPSQIKIANNVSTIPTAAVNTSNSSNHNTTNTTTNSTVKSVSISQVIAASKVVKEYYAKNEKLPSTVTVGSIKVSLAQFLYYESRAISQIANGNMSNIPIIGSLDEPSNPTAGSTSIDDNLMEEDYVDSATRTYQFILKYEQGPNYSTTTLGQVSYYKLIEAFSRVLAYYGENKDLPNYVAIDTTDSSVITSSISDLAKSLTSSISDEYTKAVVLFNWVRDNVVYSYYYNSQQGAALTLTKRSGNCCDQSNLYVAMCRAVDVTVRYVHGRCQFSDGWYGHVWTEVYVNGKWYSADPISTRNSFGTINNWNTNSVVIFNRYTNLPF